FVSSVNNKILKTRPEYPSSFNIGIICLKQNKLDTIMNKYIVKFLYFFKLNILIFLTGYCFTISANEPQLREVREFHKTKFKGNPKTQATHFGFCKFNIFYKTKCKCD